MCAKRRFSYFYRAHVYYIDFHTNVTVLLLLLSLVLLLSLFQLTLHSEAAYYFSIADVTSDIVVHTLTSAKKKKAS